MRELQAYIATHMRFDPRHAAQAAPLEFGDVGRQVEEAMAQPGRGKKVISITFEHFVQPDARDESERTYGPQSWRYADGQEHPVERWSGRRKVFPTCEHSVLGVVVAGREPYGRTLRVCVARDRCRVHFGEEIKEREKNQKLREKSTQSKPASPSAKDRAAADKTAQLRKQREADDRRRDRVEQLALDR